MPNIDLSILNQRQTPAFYADTLANRPAAGFVGRIFVSTDTYAFYRDNGTSWDLIGGPGTGTITGSGSSGSLALWNGTNTITYDVNITWNGTDNSISADKFIVNSGTSSQFLKGDGSLDSSAYVTTNIYNGNGTLSGERTLSLNGNNLIFDGGASIARVRLDADTNVARIFSFATNNVARWAFRIDDAETGSNAGSNFAVRRYDDAGTFVDAPLLINRATGQSTFAKKVVIENNAGDQQLQIVSTTAPSLRIDNLQTGATKRIGLGLATAVNNFIQGSVDQDFCIFNSTTTASPILFGVYDAGLTNTQEAARISAARNFLVGTTVDSGEKFIVSGQSRFSGRVLLNSSVNNNYLAFNHSGVQTWYQKITNTNNSSFIISNDYLGGTNILTLAENGTATFSSFVRSKYYNVTGSNGLSGYLIQQGDWAGTIGSNLSLAAETGLGISFFTNGQATTVNAFIAPSGNFLIGTTTDNGYKLRINGNVNVDGYISTSPSVNGIFCNINQHNTTVTLSSIFPNLNFTNTFISLNLQIIASSGSVTNATSFIYNCVRDYNGNWSSTLVNSVGTVAVLTLTFGGTNAAPTLTITGVSFMTVTYNISILI